MIGFVPYSRRKERNLGAIDLAELAWPLEESAPKGTISDLGREDHIILVPSSSLIVRGVPKVPCRASLFMIEPYAVQRRYYLAVTYYLWKRFHYVITRYRFLKDRIPNALVLPVTFSFVDFDAIKSVKKTRTLSIIASKKRNLKGHRLRHKLIDKIYKTEISKHIDIDTLGRGYKPFDEKHEGLVPYQFSVVIENAREYDYFSEKLLDCLICETIPIYWGAPNISEYFDMDGIIECRSLDELLMAIKMIPMINTEHMMGAIRINKEKAINYSNIYRNIAERIESLDGA